MFKYSTFCFILNAIILISTVGGQANNANTSTLDPVIQEALKYTNVVTSTIQVYINEALPLEAKTEGEQILANVKEGLRNCESAVKTVLDIGTYKACSSSLLGDGMAALGALQAKYRPWTSGASRMSLFW